MKANLAKPGIKAREAGAANKRAATQPARPARLPNAPRTPSTLQIHSILVPVDFSPESEKALAYALPFARQFGAKITLMHVVEPMGRPDFAQSFPLGMENDALMTAAKHHLDRVTRDLQIEPALVEKTLVRYGRAFNEIADAARMLKVDLIVISTHGYSGVQRVLLGSTTERVVRHAPCPVLVVRPTEHEFVVESPKPSN